MFKLPDPLPSNWRVPPVPVSPTWFPCRTTDTRWIRQVLSSRYSNRTGSVFLPSRVGYTTTQCPAGFGRCRGVPSECEADFHKLRRLINGDRFLDQCSVVPRSGTDRLHSWHSTASAKVPAIQQISDISFCPERAGGSR